MPLLFGSRRSFLRFFFDFPRPSVEFFSSTNKPRLLMLKTAVSAVSAGATVKTPAQDAYDGRSHGEWQLVH